MAANDLWILQERASGEPQRVRNPVAAIGTYGLVKKAAALTNAAPTISAPGLLTGAASITSVQALSARLEELITNLTNAGSI